MFFQNFIFGPQSVNLLQVSVSLKHTQVHTKYLNKKVCRTHRLACDAEAVSRLLQMLVIVTNIPKCKLDKFLHYIRKLTGCTFHC